jgi:hypothetical protein
MIPQAAKRKIRIERWKTIIHGRIDSGLMVNEYCIKNSISRKYVKVSFSDLL